MIPGTEVTAVLCYDDAAQERAQAVANLLGVPLNDRSGTQYSLVFDAAWVYLESNEHGKHGRIMVDFCAGSVAHRRQQGGGKGQMIAKAVGLGPKFRPRILDATAGLGKDAFVLACLGCEVTMMERSPVAFALLTDGLQRAQTFAAENDPELATILARLSLRAGDSIEFLRGATEPVAEVIYLDPMFPERQKQAAVKKEMQAFHAVIGQDLDAEALLKAAVAKAGYRVVVKRPRLAPAVDGMTASYDLQGKSSRFDIYTLKGVPK
jgi:16S rRNA (guanine1516-N2)-methyltransferase